MNTFFKVLIFVLILVIGISGLAFYWTFYKPLPNYQGDIKIDGISSQVDIYWDEFGVPHIFATNEADLYFALGYVHAQDRLWQMTLSQIAAEGRFAEFFGTELVELDKYQRTLGFWRTAESLSLNVLEDKERSVLQAYSKGVNTYVEENSNKLPVEFSLASIKPFEWNETRSIAISRLMAWDLNMGWWSEVTYGYLKNSLSAEQFSELRLSFPDSLPTTLNSVESAKYSSVLMPMLNQEIDRRKILQTEGTHVGSNAWVVDGSMTDSGYPLLAGDPHLGLDMPGKWYEVHLNLNGKNVSGATIAGIPAVIIGQNDQMAWSLTNIMADDTDFFLEIQDPNDRGRYVADSLNDSTAVYEEFYKKREIIKVKDQDDELLEIRFTKHGPIISDIYPQEELTENKLISMQWTGYEPSNEMRTLYEINWATNFQGFKDALPHFGSPGQNFMYGDKDGNIAMFSVAKLPIRSGDPITLRRGWNSEDDWQGYIPFNNLPSVINPEKGWIANANNKLTTDDYPYYLATFWEPPSRIERIEEFLQSKDFFNPDDFAELQNDTYSKFAAQTVPLILETVKNQQAYNFDRVISYLENWDFRYEKNAAAATIFDTFILKLTENTLKDEFGDAVYRHFIHHENIPIRTITALLEDSSSFFDDLNTLEVESKSDIILRSMQDAILFLSENLGSETIEWRWEKLHKITFSPPLFAQAAEDENAPSILKLIVNNMLSSGPHSAVGHGMSVNNGQYNWDKPFEMVLGASIRRIVDLSDLENIRTVIPTGQSGNPLSKHFGDQTELWLNGDYRILNQSSSISQEGKFRKTGLIPKN